MLKKIFLTTFIVTISILTSGCVNKATATPYKETAKLHSVYVKKLSADEHNIDKIIVDKFKSMGYKATSGTEVSPDTDVVVTYVDKWAWDMTMYMLELTVVVREPKTDFPLATGNSLHSSLTRESPKEMVNEVINNIFKNTKNEK